MKGAKTPAPDKDGPTSNATFPYNNDQCTSGYYCLNGTDVPTPCPAGYFSNQRGLKAPTDCSECPPGRYCDTNGLQVIADPPKFDPGVVCKSASKTPTPNDGVKGYPCPEGHYCPKGKTIQIILFYFIFRCSHLSPSSPHCHSFICTSMKLDLVVQY